MVQCRWFDSPIPNFDRSEEPEVTEVKSVKQSSPGIVRPTVHFGDETNICDLSEDTIENIESEENTKAKTKEDATNQTDRENNNNIPKKISLNPQTTSVPVIKVAKVTHLSSPSANVKTTPAQVTSIPPVPTDNEVIKVGVTLKVYAKCLAPDIEYKTVIVTKNMSSRELICLLLSKCRMKHRDPKLFYLTMDVTVKKTGIPIKRTMVLEDEARPAQLRSCNPWGECKFSLQMRKGGLVRVYDSVLVAELKYKCLLISEDTTVEDVIRILLNCYGLDKMEEISRFCIYESGDFRERKLNKNEKPLNVQSHWSNGGPYQRFVLRRATRSVSNQFPEETCVDENDRTLYWSGSAYSSSDTDDSTCGTCSEVEHVFQPISAPPNQSGNNNRLLDAVFTPTPILTTALPSMSAIPLSKLINDSKQTTHSSLFTSLPSYLDTSKPITSLDPVDTLMKEVQEMQVNLITRPYIGSVCNSMDSDKSEHSHSEHFFYI